jgi:hypothetical protein
MPQAHSGNLRELEVLAEQYAQQSGLLDIDVQILEPVQARQYSELGECRVSPDVVIPFLLSGMVYFPKVSLYQMV